MDDHTTRFLFHREAFIFRNPENSVILFDCHAGKIYFSRIDNSLISLDRAPFGSFILEKNVTGGDLISLIEKIVLWSKQNGIINLMIRSFPEIYQPRQSALIKEALTESGFNIRYEDITQVILVMPRGEMNLNTHKKRRLRKAEASRFGFRAIPLNLLGESYSLIVGSRKNKGYPVTMSLKDLQDMFKLFPNDYLLFGVFDNKKLIAASISIQVNPEILYCFYIGDDLAYRQYSPVTLLINGIYHYCQKMNFKILDLGLSTDKGIVNKGLYTFKKTFGSIDSYKFTFLKQL